MKLKKRIQAGLMAALMGLTLCVSQVNVKAAPAIPSDLTDILSSYQFFVDDDLSGSGHQMGGVVVGGTCATDGLFGDLAKEPSYIGVYEKGTQGSASYGAFDGSWTINKDVYYSEAEASVNSNWTQLSGIAAAVDTAFESIREQSEELASEATLVEADANNQVIIDCTGDSAVNIKMTMKTWNTSTIILKVDSVDWFQNHLCVVSVVDDESYSSEENNTTQWSPYTGRLKININGTESNFQGNLKSMTNVDDSQFCEQGMNLVWNFPNASGTISCSELSGHLVAPNAHVTVSANYEGTIVAKSLTTSAQGHFYPMSLDLDTNSVGPVEPSTEETTTTTEEPTTATPEETGSLSVVITEETSGDPIKGATVQVKDSTGNVIATLTTSEDGKTDVVDGLTIGETYTVHVTSVPDGYITPADETGYIKDTSNVEVPLVVKKETGSLSVVITEETSGDPIQGATVQVKDSTGKVIATLTTSEDGKTDVVDGLTIGETYTVHVTSVPDGYITPADETGYIKDTSNVEVPLVVKKETGSLSVVITEETSGDPIKGATVQVKDSTGNVIATLTTSEDGKTDVVDGLTIGETYTVHVTSVPEGYITPADETGYIKDTSNVEVPLVVKKETGSLSVVITEETSGDPIKGATVQVKDSTGKVIATLTTSEDGKTDVVDGLTIGETYTVHVTEVPEGYIAPADETGYIKDTSNVEVLLVVKKETGSLSVVITDETTGEPIPEATVEIKDSTGKVIATVVTDENGKTEVVDELTIGETYTVHVTEVPDGYNTPSDKTQKITSTETVEVPLVVKKEETEEPEETGSLSVVITDETTGEPIPGATVEIKDSTGKVIKTVVTDKDGKTEVVDELTIGETYTVHVTEVPDGYNTPSDKTQKITSTETVKVPLVVKKEETEEPEETGSLSVVITDETTGEPIPGATVEIKDSTGKVIKTVVTDKDGKTEVVDELTIGETYTVHVTEVPDGYNTPSDKTQKITSTETVEVPLVVKKEETVEKGSLIVEITDEDTNDPIPGAIVEIKDSTGKVVSTVVTDGSGKTPKADSLTIGETYTVHVKEVPDGYNPPEDKKKEITSSTTVIVELVVKKEETEEPEETGSLSVVITDETTGEPIPGATVEIKDSTGKVIKTVVTDKDGKTEVVNELTIGETYTVHVTEVPDGYNAPADKTQKITSTETVEVPLVVKKEETEEPEETGSLSVIITDETTGEPIPGATVQVKDSKGNVIATLTTDANGKTTVVKELTIGETYTVHVKEVPDGYNAPSDKTQKITSTETVEVPLVVKKADAEVPEETGSMSVVITDKETGEPIPGATVEIKDSTGKVIATVVTDENGKTPVVDELEIGKNYTVHVTEVPDGYNAPSDKTQKITSSENVEVPVNVNKTETTTTETGSLTVTITDEITKEPIPGATVEIKDSTGTVIGTVVTDEFGKTPAVNDLEIGETYTVHVVEVPDGYNIPSDKTQTIESSLPTNVPLEITTDVVLGSLYVIITDKNTGAVIPDAQVSVKNSSGKEVANVRTDASGSFTLVDLPVDTYTIATLSVPDGYTIPAAETATVVAGARVDRHLLVQKQQPTGVTTSQVVKTGDEMPVALIAILGAIACIGAVGFAFDKKRNRR